LLLVFLLGGFLILHLKVFGGGSEEVLAILFILRRCIVLGSTFMRSRMWRILLLRGSVLRGSIARIIVLPTTSSTCIPVQILEMVAAATSILSSSTTRIKMIASGSSLIATEVLLRVGLAHRPCRGLIRRRLGLIVVVIALRTTSSGVV
jgi:hypothetical protein